MTDREVSITIPEGWRLGSLCELPPGWYVCLVDDEEFVHTATGNTPTEASFLAWHAPAKGRLYNADRVATEPVKAMDLLAQLNLIAPVELKDRRI